MSHAEFLPTENKDSDQTLKENLATAITNLMGDASQAYTYNPADLDYETTLEEFFALFAIDYQGIITNIHNEQVATNIANFINAYYEFMYIGGLDPLEDELANPSAFTDEEGQTLYARLMHNCWQQQAWILVECGADSNAYKDSESQSNTNSK